MARIQLKQLAHCYQGKARSLEDYALRPCDHVWKDGGAYALLGPSGCGKTTLLNLISGLLQPSEGRILFDERDVTNLSTKERNIAQVFQFPVIYDTMSVYENLAFPLRNRQFSKADTHKRVHEVADMLELSSELHKTAKGLSADLKQMISLGRGLVRQDVSAILFDEPLTVIDPHLKWVLRRKLKQIHEQFNLTFVYVTHDQNEALTFASQVVVMSQGEVLQVGTPQDLFDTPEHAFVGHFIGSPGMNFLPCALNGQGIIVEGHKLALPSSVLARAAGLHASDIQIGVRPEYLNLSADKQDSGIPVSLHKVEDLGNYKIVSVRLGASLLKVKLQEAQELPGERAYLQFPAQMTKLYVGGRLVHAGSKS